MKKFWKSFYGLPFSENNLNQAEKSLKNMPSLKPEFLSIDEQQFIINNMKELVAQHYFLTENKRHAFWHKILWIVISIFLVCISSFVVYVIPNFEENILVFFIIISTVFQLFRINSYDYDKARKDLVKQTVAQRNGWLYDFKPSKRKASELHTKFPTIFSGDKIVSVDDEFFGIKKVKANNYYFKSGIYTYKIKKKSKNRRKYYITKHKNYLLMTLNKKLNVEFSLIPEFLNGFFNSSDKEITLESNEFNTMFKFQYSGKKSDLQDEVVKILSPAVQLGLVELAKKNINFKFLFTENAVIFSFDGELVSGLKTKIYDYSGVHKEDVDVIDKMLKELLDLSTHIVKYLD